MGDNQSLTAHADELYRERGRPNAVEESVRLLSDSALSDKYGAQWRLSRGLFFLGQEAAPGDSKSQLHDAGVRAGARAVALARDGVEGNFWIGVNLALFAESRGGVRGARALLRARQALRRAAAISENYHGAGPLRVLGRLEHRAPRWLGGSAKRARKCFERALAIESCNSVTILYAAEFFREVGELDRSRMLLNRLMDCPECPEWAYENQRDREAARKLLGKFRTAQ